MEKINPPKGLTVLNRQIRTSKCAILPGAGFCNGYQNAVCLYIVDGKEYHFCLLRYQSYIPCIMFIIVIIFFIIIPWD